MASSLSFLNSDSLNVALFALYQEQAPLLLESVFML